MCQNICWTRGNCLWNSWMLPVLTLKLNDPQVKSILAHIIVEHPPVKSVLAHVIVEHPPVRSVPAYVIVERPHVKSVLAHVTRHIVSYSHVMLNNENVTKINYWNWPHITVAGIRYCNLRPTWRPRLFGAHSALQDMPGIWLKLDFQLTTNFHKGSCQNSKLK